MKPSLEALIRKFDYLDFNLRKAIKHEIEMTNLRTYKNDVPRYMQEMRELIREAHALGKEEAYKEVLVKIEELRKE